MAVHPYIPNTVPEVQKQMMKEIGVNDLEELYADIPEELRLRKTMNIPAALTEFELQKHIQKTLDKNKSSKEQLSFLGAGCWPHFVPAVCDEINQRSEFATAYAGEPYEDHGRFQALYEYQSLVGELVDMDVVNVPTFDWGQAASTAIRMSSRVTKRYEALVPSTTDPDRLRIIRNYCSPDIQIKLIDHNPLTGQLDIEDLKSKLSERTAAVYFENPSFLGFIEENGQMISDLAHKVGALSVVGIDPSSLGVLEPPSRYGADIVCGDLQPLGIHMNYGGGQSGFIATHDDEKIVMEFPSRLFGIVPTCVEGEYGFGDVAYERTSFADREKGKESVGTQTALWGITAGVYLSLMGPEGMWELGQGILQRSQYAIDQLNQVPGVKGSKFKSSSFKEFVLDFNETGKSVKEIHDALYARGIQGGKDLSKDFPAWGQTALYCVTEVHSQEDIDQLVATLRDIVTT